MELEGEAQGREESQEKEGRFLLGSPTFDDIGNGRLRCVETGHELLAEEADAYGKSKGCRLALIESSLAKKKPPLNMFKADPLCKSKLICKLTGANVNKAEEHIWKHITGRRFLSKLKQKEADNAAPSSIPCNKKSQKSLDSSIPCPKKAQKKIKSMEDHVKIEATINGGASDEMEAMTTGYDLEEPDFWMPPLGKRWDFDDGKDRWDLSTTSVGACQDVHVSDSASGDLSVRTKRMSIAVGPSSFASRKKKSRKNEDDDSNKS